MRSRSKTVVTWVVSVLDRIRAHDSIRENTNDHVTCGIIHTTHKPSKGEQSFMCLHFVVAFMVKVMNIIGGGPYHEISERDNFTWPMCLPLWLVHASLLANPHLLFIEGYRTFKLPLDRRHGISHIRIYVVPACLGTQDPVPPPPWFNAFGWNHSVKNSLPSRHTRCRASLTLLPTCLIPEGILHPKPLARRSC